MTGSKAEHLIGDHHRVDEDVGAELRGEVAGGATRSQPGGEIGDGSTGSEPPEPGGAVPDARRLEATVADGDDVLRGARTEAVGSPQARSRNVTDRRLHRGELLGSARRELVASAATPTADEGGEDRTAAATGRHATGRGAAPSPAGATASRVCRASNPKTIANPNQMIALPVIDSTRKRQINSAGTAFSSWLAGSSA